MSHIHLKIMKPAKKIELSCQRLREKTHSQACAYVHSCDSGICVVRQGTWNNSDQHVQKRIGSMNEGKRQDKKKLESILQKSNGQSASAKLSEIKNSLDVCNNRWDKAKKKKIRIN